MGIYVDGAGRPVMIAGGAIREATGDDPDPTVARHGFEIVKVDLGDPDNDGWYLQSTSALPSLPSGATNWAVKVRVSYSGPDSVENIVRWEGIYEAGDDVSFRLENPTSSTVTVLLAPMGATTEGVRRLGNPKVHRVAVDVPEDPPVEQPTPGLTAAQITSYMTIVDDPYNSGYFTLRFQFPEGHPAYEAVTMRWSKYGPALTEIDDPYPTNYPMVRLDDVGTDRVWRFEERYPGDSNKKHARLAGANFVHLGVQYQLPAVSSDTGLEAGPISPVIEWFSVTIPADTSEAPVISTTGTFISPTSPFETDTLTVVRQASGNPDPIVDGTWTYQWKESTVNITDATSQTLAPSEFTAADYITCAVGVTTSSGSDSFTTSAVVIATTPSIKPATLGPSDWEIVEVVEHPSKAGYYTAHVRLLLAGPPTEYAVFWSDWVSNVQPKPGFPCDFVETDGDGRKVWRLADFPANGNKWNTILPSSTLSNIQLRYQLVDHGSNVQADYVSDNSTDKKSFDAPDPADPGDPGDDPIVPEIPTAVLNVALNESVFRITDTNDYAMARFPWNYGPLPTILALRLLRGEQSSVLAKVKDQVDEAVHPTKCMTMLSGYSMQHDMQHAAFFAIIRQIPSFWDSTFMNSSSRKAKIDALMEGVMVAGAWGCSDVSTNNGELTLKDLRGYSGFKRNWNGNFRLAQIGAMLCAVAYFGSASAAKTLLDNYNHNGGSAVKARLNTYGLTNARKTFYAVGTGNGTPTVSGLNAACNSFKYYSRNLTDIAGIIDLEIRDWFRHPITTGLNNGAGYQGRAKMITGANVHSNMGQPHMAEEFAASDSGGPRSSMSYVWGGTRAPLMWLSALAAAGIIGPSTSGMPALVTKFNKGILDMREKHEKGYYSYARGGNGNSETWTSAWGEDKYRATVTLRLWEDVLSEMLS